MKVFLTGGTGTIGLAVTAALIARGHRVSGLARSPEAGARLRSHGASAWSGDIGEPRDWLDAALSCDCLVHLANSFDASAHRAERRLVAALKALPPRAEPFHLVTTGGVWLYPETTGVAVRETTSYAPLPAFAHVANAIRSLASMRHLALSVIHPALVCSRDAGPIADMRRAAETGRPFATRAGRQTLWPLVEVEDLADLYVRAVEARRYRLTAIGCAVEGVPMEQLMRLVSDRTGLRLDLEHPQCPACLPADLDIEAGYARSQRASGDGARKLLGWQPRFTDATALVDALLPVAG
jgi:nucleoside-diphosphate-sugar epimerase